MMNLDRREIGWGIGGACQPTLLPCTQTHTLNWNWRLKRNCDFILLTLLSCRHGRAEDFQIDTALTFFSREIILSTTPNIGKWPPFFIENLSKTLFFIYEYACLSPERSAISEKLAKNMYACGFLRSSSYFRFAQNFVTVKYGNFGHVDALKKILKFEFYSYYFLIYFNHSIKFRGSIYQSKL